MARIILNTVALDPLRWATPKRSFYDLVDLVALIAAIGFKGLEIWQYHLAGLTPDGIDKLKTALDQAGLATVVVGLYPVLAGPSAAESVEESRGLMHVAQELGARSIKVFVGDKPSESITDAEWRESLKNLDEMIRVASELDLEFDGETHQNTLFDDILSVEHTMAAIGEGRMGICFQPYDFSDSFGTIEVLRKLSPDVRHLHFQGRTASGDFCLLRDAPIDYRRMLGILARSGFDGPLSIEFVKDCVVPTPADFDLDLVLANAAKDLVHLELIAREAGLRIEG
jgi:sugar phosphate isomerase/epimerase